MGDSHREIRGVLSRTAALLNNVTFSDVELHVKNTDGSYKIYHGHKLILAMAGKKFAEMFFNNKREAQNVYKIIGSTPYIFNLMLQYVYCDKINLTSIEDAINLFKLAKHYGIEDLLEECHSHISKFNVNIDTVFAKYEIAVHHNIRELLQVCRTLICSETKAVFKSPHFCNVSHSVVEDILKQDCLSVSSELEVIEAALLWSKAECRRKDRPPEAALCQRDAILPLCKHLRFLCLTIDEFLDFVDKNDILTSSESTKLTTLILEKEAKCTVPDDFSPICRPRRSNITNPNANFNGNLKPITLSHKLKAPSPDIDIGTYQKTRSKPITPPLKMDTHYNIDIANFKQTNHKTPLTVEPEYFPYKAESPQPMSSNMNVLPLYQYVANKRNSPTLKVMPQTMTQKLTFEFPLKEMQKGIGSAVNRDIKCVAKIKMFKGLIVIHGMELKVMDLKGYSDEFVVHLCFSGGNLTPKTYSHTIQLKNSLLALTFSEPYRVFQGNSPLDIEVTIEDLKLNRCNVCRESKCELNCGLSVMAEISLESNQSNGPDSFFFLIHRLIYSIV